MISQAELDHFYEALVSSVQARGGVCAITSGMACVEYGVAQSTKDCDILCSADSVAMLLDLLAETEFAGTACSYRGHLTAPLDARWMCGGWTAHFAWKSAEATAHLDVFGIAPRGSSDWMRGRRGLLAGMHTVAEMKRTDRAKDWPFATALGVKLLEEGNLDGWLHIFDADALRQAVLTAPLPDEIVRRRPVLQLLVQNDPRLRVGVFGETLFWQNLDRVRLDLHEAAVRKYLKAVRHDPDADASDLRTQHRVRVGHAEVLLPRSPLVEYGIERLIEEARRRTAEFVVPGALEWLPDATANFYGLE